MANEVHGHWGIRPDYEPWGFTVQSMPFPHLHLTHHPSEWIDVRRIGKNNNVLVVTRRHWTVTRYWIDRASLAVLGVIHVDSGGGYLVRQPVAQAFHDGS
ncbi:MAG: hypothetical protein ACR2NM_02755 [Bythopirellula sp.]